MKKLIVLLAMAGTAAAFGSASGTVYVRDGAQLKPTFVSPQEKSPANGAAAVFEKSFANIGAVRRATCMRSAARAEPCTCATARS